MAFSYTTDFYDQTGKVKKVYGTWNGASVTSGTISFGPINGLSIKPIACSVANSVSATTETAKKLVLGSVSTQNTIALTCVSNDKGYWWAEWL